jgi:hyperosmotically inducible periplasmic protein
LASFHVRVTLVTEVLARKFSSFVCSSHAPANRVYHTNVVPGILIAAGIAVLTTLMAYMGVHVTLHPPETQRSRLMWKVGFSVVAMAGIALVAAQTRNNAVEQQTLRDEMARIEKNTRQPPTVQVTVPPAQVVISPANETPVESEIEVKATDQPSGIDAAGDRTKAGFGKGVDATANAARKTTQAVEKGIGESEQGAGKAAEKTAQRVGKAGEKMTDASITMRVKARFNSEYLLRGSQIHIQTNDHVVTLTGRVSSEAARDRSIELAQNLGGVQSVIDELHVAKP